LKGAAAMGVSSTVRNPKAISKADAAGSLPEIQRGIQFDNRMAQPTAARMIW
jgi:hypothetical protein